MRLKRLIIIVVFLVVIIVIFFMVHKRSAYAPVDLMTVPTIAYSGGASGEIIIIDSLIPGDEVSSPLEISGSAVGSWYFEASFPIIVVNWDGLIIGEGYATAQDDWMTEEMVPFRADVSFDVPGRIPTGFYEARGAVIFKNDNPSGEPGRDMAVEIPVIFR